MLNICVSVTLNQHRFVCQLESITDFSYVLKLSNIKLNSMLLVFCFFFLVKVYQSTLSQNHRKWAEKELQEIILSISHASGRISSLSDISDKCQFNLVLKPSKTSFIISVRNSHSQLYYCTGQTLTFKKTPHTHISNIRCVKKKNRRYLVFLILICSPLTI